MPTPSTATVAEATWGEEVMRGITLIRRNAPHPLVAQGIASAVDTQAKGFALAPNDLVLLHDSIDDTAALIHRLESSNEQLREYLREAALEAYEENPDAEDNDDGCCSMAQMSPAANVLPASHSDPEIEDAISENESILKAKRRELAELRALLAFASCGRMDRGIPKAQYTASSPLAEEEGPIVDEPRGDEEAEGSAPPTSMAL